MEGGMVNTDSRELMETLVSLRSHGWTRGLNENNSVHSKSKNEWEDLFRFVLPGYNIRPTELSGAIGKVQLQKLPKFIDARLKNATFFQELFKNSKTYKIQKEVGSSSWFGFSIILQNELAGKREKLIEFLTKHHIETRPIVAGNFTLNPVMKYLNVAPLPNLINANKVHVDGFFIGNHHFDVSEDLENLYLLLIEFEKDSNNE
jgi:CDP-6-deoxy-D-xylo-4-hexulose-3-dehydrase